MRLSGLVLAVSILCMWSSSSKARTTSMDRSFLASSSGFEDFLHHEPNRVSVQPRGNNSDGQVQPRHDAADGRVQPEARGIERGTYKMSPGSTYEISSEELELNPGATWRRWSFTADSKAEFSVKCETFKLESSLYCGKQYLMVKYPGTSIHRFCGETTPSTTGITDILTVVFKTKENADGSFKCTVTVSGDPTPTITESTPSPGVDERCVCGLVNRATRIVGGVVTEEHEYPWQVALTDRSGRPYCGASIINDQWILTAAHCVNGNSASNIRAVVGEHDWSTSSETSATQRLEIAEVIVHENYNSRTLNNDIALLKLNEPIEFLSDNKIAPVCLPRSNVNYDNVEATVTGWGTLSSDESQPVQLNEVTVPTMTNDECSTKYGRGSITSNMICAGLDDGGKDSCQGDSGGPMVAGVDNSSANIELIGIVSWGFGCAEPGYPGVYTRVTEYLNWIADNTSGSTKCSPPSA